ncbi:MAG TPA: hypothetical protein VGO47_00335 [Chlamydiales bacterium]|nr:hypothetical protein [Chlamydiales bacterium]
MLPVEGRHDRLTPNCRKEYSAEVSVTTSFVHANVNLSSLRAILKEWRSAGHSKEDDRPWNIWNLLAPFFD